MTTGPLAITPALLAEHKLTAAEYERILEVLGRAPNLVGLAPAAAAARAGEAREHCERDQRGPAATGHTDGRP